jgi:hypothetical protein
MQELLLGTWGLQILAYSQQILTYCLQYPWRVFVAVLVGIWLLNLMFGKKRSSGDGLDVGGFDFGDGGCGD